MSAAADVVTRAVAGITAVVPGTPRIRELQALAAEVGGGRPSTAAGSDGPDRTDGAGRSELDPPTGSDGVAPSDVPDLDPARLLVASRDEVLGWAATIVSAAHVGPAPDPALATSLLEALVCASCQQRDLPVLTALVAAAKRLGLDSRVLRDGELALTAEQCDDGLFGSARDLDAAAGDDHDLATEARVTLTIQVVIALLLRWRSTGADDTARSPAPPR